MQYRVPHKAGPCQGQAFRDGKYCGSEYGVKQPVAALPQQVACCHRLPSTQVRLGNSIDGSEPGGQYPCRRNEHPGLKQLKALSDAHTATLAQEPPADKKNEYIVAVFDRSRQQTDRSRITRCRISVPPCRMSHYCRIITDD